jgi:hypothetical protein
VKVLCGGSDADIGKRWIKSLAHRDITSAMLANATPQKQDARKSTKEGGGCSVEYHKKDYTFQTPSGEVQTTRIQFLHWDGPSSESPPQSWEITRHKVDSALFIVDLQHLILLWKQNNLTSYMEHWWQLFNLWTYPQLPINLLVTNVPSNNSVDVAVPPVLFRAGAAIASAAAGGGDRRRGYGSTSRPDVSRMFLVGLNATDSVTSEGLDSVDGILQTLVQQALQSKETKVATLDGKTLSLPSSLPPPPNMTPTTKSTMTTTMTPQCPA